MGPVAKQRDQEVVRVALHEIERLLFEAGRSGMPVTKLVDQMAGELRSAVPELQPETAAWIIRRMLENPGRSIEAQGSLDMASLIALKQ